METEFALSLGTQRWALPAGSDTITIGRASNADVRLQADDQISRIHARLSRTGTTWTLHDESRNGTGLNGRRLAAPTPLTEGDRIHIGRSVLTFHEPPTPIPAPPAPAAPTPFTDDPAPSNYPPPSPASPPPADSPPADGGPFAPAPPPPDPAGQYPSHEHPSPANGKAQTPVTRDPGATPPAPPRAATPFTDGEPENRYAPPPSAAPGSTPPADGRPFAPTPTPDPAGQYPSHEHPSPADAHAATPFTPARPTPSQFAPGEPEQSRFAPGEREQSQFAPGEREQSQFAPGEGEQSRSGPGEPEQGRFAPGEREQSRFTSGEGEHGAFGSGESEGLDNAVAPPAPPDIPRRTDAPSNFPLFPAEPQYQGSDEPPYEGAGQAPYQGAGEADWAADDAWDAYPSADNAEPARSPWDSPPAAQIEQSQPNWNESASWPAIQRDAEPGRRLPSANRTTGDRDRDRGRTGAGARAGAGAKAGTRTGGGASARDGDEEVGTVRLLRVLLIAAFIIVLGLLINLTVTFLADGPGGVLRWLIPPAIALVVAMIVALLDAAAPTNRAPSRLDVSIIIAIVVVLLGVGVGGFALTAGAEYVGGYLTGNESGEDRLIKPAAKPIGDLTVTVENVTYTSHFTRVEVKLTNGGKQPVSLPLTKAASLAAADGTALHADTSRSQWPGSIPNGGTDHGSITFKGHLPDATTSATLTLKSGDPAVAVPVALSN